MAAEMTAMEDVLQTVREVRQEVLPYLDFATQVSALAVRLAERGDPVALDLLELVNALNARVDEFDIEENE